MGTTALEAARSQWQPFYWLKITGLPFYVFANVDPTNSVRFGSFAWTLPTDYSPIRGMDPPSDTIEQALPDLVGGVCSAARCRLRLLDIELSGSGGRIRLFGKLIAPGRARNSSLVKWAFLDGDLPANYGSGNTFTIRSNTAFPAAPANVYIGSETIGYSAISGPTAGVQTLTIAARQKFPAIDAWNGKTWPSTPYYRVVKDALNLQLPSANPYVTSDAVGLIGRTCALWAGHLEPNGMPSAEADGVLLMAGRLKGFEYDSGVWLAEMQSVVADVAQAALAPGLERAEIQPDQIVVPDLPHMRTFLFGLRGYDGASATTLYEKDISIAAGTYTLFELQDAIRAAFAALATVTGPWSDHAKKITLGMEWVEGTPRTTFTFFNNTVRSDYSPSFFLRHGFDPFSVSGPGGVWPNVNNIIRHDESLLSCLGFSKTTELFASANPSISGGSNNGRGFAEKVYNDGPTPSIMVPTMGSVSSFVYLKGPDAPGSRFFLDQGDGSGRAWVRLDDGKIVLIVDASVNSVTLGNSIQSRFSQAPVGVNTKLGPVADGAALGWYTVPVGQSGIVEQVIVTPDPGIAAPAAPRIVGQLLASDNAATAADDFNVFPEGVGLGLGALMDKPSWRTSVTNVGARRFIVDRNTKAVDVLDAICKEYGLFAAWDPVAGAITLRKIRLPSASGASLFTFTDGNRAQPDDMTKAAIDYTAMRSSWSVKIGWDAAQQKFTGPSITVNDYFSVNEFGISPKDEAIADKSLQSADSVGAMLEQLFTKRAVFYRFPWTRLQRSVQKSAIFLAPGTVHKIIDARIHNPYTGVFGIAADDEIYGLLTKVSMTPATGLVNVELVVQGREPPDRIRPVAPVGLVDFSADTGGYARGYKVGPPDTLTMARRYTQNADGSVFDGVDFAVGDKIRLTTKDNDGIPLYTHSDEIAAISDDGGVVTLVVGGWFVIGWSTVSETIMIGETWDNASAAQQSRHPFLGSAKDGEVAAAILNHIWA